MAGPRRRVRLAKSGAWALGLYPLARLAWWLRDGVHGLGANPIERVLHHTGWWALILLFATLSISPARRLTGRNELATVRRPLGLFAFFYATLHLAIYLSLDQLFAWSFILEDILERPFISVGMAAWLLLLPLAVTSTRRWVVRLGKRWALLHRLIYPATALGLLHYFWRVRADTRVPLILAAILAILLLLRIRRRPAKPRRPATRMDAQTPPTE